MPSINQFLLISHSPKSLQTLLLIFFFILCAVPIFIAIKRRTFDIFEPIVIYALFSTMVGIIIINRVYFQDGYVAYQDIIGSDTDTALLIATGLYVVFLTVLLCGYYLNITRWVTVPKIETPNKGYNNKLLRKFGLLYILFGIFFYLVAVYINLGGDIFILFTDADARSEVSRISGPLQLGVNLLPFGYLIWLTGLVNENRRFNIMWVWPLILITFMLLLFGGRSYALSNIISVIVFLYYSMLFGSLNIRMGRITLVSDKIHFYLKMAIVPIVGFCLGIIAILIGSLRRGRDLQTALESIDIVRILTAGIPNDRVDNLILTIEMVPEEFGYFWGTHILRAPLNWFPRAFWEEKPVLTAGSILRREVWPDQTGGRAVGEIGRFYMDLGLPGVIIGALLSGIILRFTYELLRSNHESPLFLMAYSIVLFSIATGPLLNGRVWTLMTTVVLLSPLIVFHDHLAN